jgi:hypothetical protein
MVKIARKSIIAVLVAVPVLLVVASFFGMRHTSTPEFCGTTCHIMATAYTSWERDKKHFEAETACIECHYAPGEKYTLRAQFKGMGQVFTYLAEPEIASVAKRPAVKDAACTTSECHPPEGYLEKNIRYINLPSESKYLVKVDRTRKYENLQEIKQIGGIPFLHKTHDEKVVEGQKMHCNTCHQKVTAQKHFEVPVEACYLCHFKNVAYNDGRSKCDLCHEIPTKPLQAQAAETSERKPDEEPITHASLEKSNVPCISCHYVIQGGGDVVKESCYVCHDVGDEERLALTDSWEEGIPALDKKKMHEKHIAEQHANCFQCHGAMEHRQVEQTNDLIVQNCSGCHQNTHLFQRQLLAGDILESEPVTPALMAEVSTNCLGCHIKLSNNPRGDMTAKADAESCVSCHTERHKSMLKEWEDKIKEELTVADEIENEAKEVLARAKGKLPGAMVSKAEEMFVEGEKYLNVVRYGNGVHNKKYAITLIDYALNLYEDMIDDLEEEFEKPGKSPKGGGG